jgi:hypothetical protein
MRKNRFPVLSVVLYVLAVLLLAYSVWAAIYSSKIVSQAIDMGQLMFAGSEFEVLSFYMSNVAQYFLFAVVLFILGYMLQTNPAQEVFVKEILLEDTEEEEVPAEPTEDVLEDALED